MSFFVVIVGENSADYPEFARGARNTIIYPYRKACERRRFVACDKSSDGQSENPADYPEFARASKVDKARLLRFIGCE